MEQVEWEVVSEIAGELNAELIKGLLESQGIPVMLSQEGLGHSVLSLTVGPLGRVQVLVPSSLVPRAQQVLSDYENGLFESPDTQDSQTGDEN
jgi:Putative prokaryotic signal transducing protein